jgi:Recombinational DNA repair protein (RecF pathway)
MSGMYEGAIQDLIDALGRLPGIGPKSAQRIAFHILQSDSEVASALVDSIRVVKERVKFCVQCGNVSEKMNVAFAEILAVTTQSSALLKRVKM